MGWYILPCWNIVGDKCACPKTICTSPGKHPLEALVKNGHKEATTDADTITAWFSEYPHANIGVHMARSGLCAVDIDPRNGGDITIDELEAQHGPIVSDVLQLTAGGGEHRIFDKPEGELPGTLGNGIDLKLNGYIIVEPSNHISGRNYQWEACSNPLEGAIPSPLPDWIRSHKVDKSDEIAAGLRVSISNEQLKDLGLALQFVDYDDRDTWLKVGMALHATSDSRAYQLWTGWSANSNKFDSGDQYRVWRSFKNKGLDGLCLASVFAMAQNNGWVNTARVSEPTEILVNTIPEATNIKPEVPGHLLTLPVAQLEILAHWMDATTDKPQRQITVNAVLALASVLAGRLYRSTNGNMSSAYFVTLAGTGVGKNYVKSAAKRFLDETGQIKLLSGSGNTSSGAVFTALFTAPTHIQITDEFGKHLQMARKQKNGAMSDALAVLTEAFSDVNSVILPRNQSLMAATTEQLAKHETRKVECPAITLFGIATPDQVYDNLTTSEIDDGFLNRLVVVEATEPVGAKRQRKFEAVPQILIDWVKSIRQPRTDSLLGLDTAYNLRPNHIAVQFDPAAWQLFEAFTDEIEQNELKGEYVEPKLTKRWNENALRIATALAVADSPKAPVITSEIAQWCIDYVRYYGMQFMQAIASKVADSDFHRLYLEVERLVNRAGEGGITERELSHSSRLFKSTPPIQRNHAYQALVSEQKIEQVIYKSVSGRGRAKVVWVACHHLKND
jgi:hypothetical protein